VPLILLALLFLVVVAFGGVVLLSIALRYRAGTARRQARRWVATLNVGLTAFSAGLFLLFAAGVSFWVEDAFRFALAGAGTGGLLGLFGLVLTRWEPESDRLFYTPSRWLALLVTGAIAARFIYGFWRHFHPVETSSSNPLLNASATQLSLAVAAGLISYYLIYAIGARLHIARHEQRRALDRSAANRK
jgi:MFS family permease